MKHPVHLTIDPVCLRRLEASAAWHQFTYRNVGYRFCSAHCLERFAEMPEFFSAPRRLEDNRPIPKQHRLRVAPVSSSVIDEAMERLRALQGVIRASASSGHVDLEYDLRLVSLGQIEALLASAGVPLKRGVHRLFRSFWRFSEHNELANMASQSSPCCSRPPVRVR